MNLSPIAMLSIAPAAKLVARGVSQLADSGREFASYLLDKPNATGAESSRGGEHSLSPKLEALLEPLRSFLAGQGFSPDDRIELVSNGIDSIQVDGEPYWREMAQDWIDRNPEWSGAWRQAVQSESSDSLPPLAGNPSSRFHQRTQLQLKGNSELQP